MESEAVASTDKATTEKSSGDTAGRATLDSSGGSSLTRSVSRADAVTTNPSATARVANASYPESPATASGQNPAGASNVRSYKGPALSDFLSRRQTENVAAVAETANAIAGPAVPRADNSVGPRSAVASEIDNEVNGFNSFLQQKTNAVNTTLSTRATQVTNTVKQSEQSVDEFTGWAADEKKRLVQNGSDAAAAVSAAPAAARDQVKASAKQARKVVDDAVMDFNDVQFEETTTAQPLMKKYAEPTFDSEAAFKDVRKPTVAVEENPFDNPFDSPGTAPVSTAVPKPKTSSRTPPSAVNSRKTLDESFQMDSGWKPSNMTPP